jgi:hypothetical protein
MSGNSAAEQWRLYATPQGTKVVRDEIDAFEVDAKAAVIELMKRMESDPESVLPREVEGLGDGLTVAEDGLRSPARWHHAALTFSMSH